MKLEGLYINTAGMPIFGKKTVEVLWCLLGLCYEKFDSGVKYHVVYKSQLDNLRYSNSNYYPSRNSMYHFTDIKSVGMSKAHFDFCIEYLEEIGVVRILHGGDIVLTENLFAYYDDNGNFDIFRQNKGD